MDDPRRLPVPVGEPPRTRTHHRVAGAIATWSRRRPIGAALIVLVAVSVFFLVFSDLDRVVAGLFFVPGRGFPIERMAGPILLREAGMTVTRWATILLVLALLSTILLPLVARMLPLRRILFLAASLALGPGLLVNAVLKEFWGRPRPREILDFGGVHDFFAAGIPGGGCASNCSFPSGEASSAAWLFALVFVVPIAWRKRTAIAVAAWAVVISANRIAFGGHFLSDVLIAWTLVAIVVLWCRRVFLDGLSDRTVDAIAGFLGRLGDALLGRLDHLRRRDDDPSAIWRNPVG